MLGKLVNYLDVPPPKSVTIIRGGHNNDHAVIC